MRTLAIAALGVLAACNGPDTGTTDTSIVGGTEDSCVDGVDNDGDGDVDCGDSDCADDEGCKTDDDGDGYFAEDNDCDDNNADVHPDVDEEVLECNNGIDENCDGSDVRCTEIWSLGGSATVDSDAGTYVGMTYVQDVSSRDETNVLCRWEWTVATASGPAVACPTCDFAFDLTHNAYDSKEGVYCDQWYIEADWEFGPAKTLIGAATYDSGLAVMIQGEDASGSTYWYATDPAYTEVTFDGSTFEWEYVLAILSYYPY